MGVAVFLTSKFRLLLVTLPVINWAFFKKIQQLCVTISYTMKVHVIDLLSVTQQVISATDSGGNHYIA